VGLESKLPQREISVKEYIKEGSLGSSVKFLTVFIIVIAIAGIFLGILKSILVPSVDFEEDLERITGRVVEEQSVINFVLIDADTDTPITEFNPLIDGVTINLATLPTRNLNVRADTSPSIVGSVKFALDGNSNYRTENIAPYALEGDTNADYKPWTPSLGSHTLTATPYSLGQTGGTQGTALTITFNVVDDAPVPPPPPPVPPVKPPAVTPTIGSELVSIKGVLTAWHPIELWLEGPSADETDDNPNPFLDYRFEVTFTSPAGKSYKVPGFFDGDGTGKGSGNIWKIRFAPDQGGSWNYLISFKQGTEISVEKGTGTKTSYDGISGTFSVAPRNSNAPGFLKHGILEYANNHYLKFRDGPYFIKGGTDSPENFFGYLGFDDIKDNGGQGILHSYGSHVPDWNSGDPYFRSSNTGVDSKGIIGAINYLSSKHVNSIYFLPMNLGGDGQDTTPFGYKKTRYDKTHYDISRLNQWNQVLNHGQEKGILWHFVLCETEENNENWLDDGLARKEFDIERKLYFRELIARFGYLLGIKWNLCEENDFPLYMLEDFADYIQDLEPYDHPIGVHTHIDDPEYYYDDMLGDSRFSITSIQYRPRNGNNHVEKWREESTKAGRPWVVDMDEQGGSEGKLKEDNADELRKTVLYPVYFSGGNVEWYMGSDDTKLEDFETREDMWNYMWYARSFLETLPFWEMQPMDNLLGKGNGQVFAKQNEIYAVYLEDGEGSLDLSSASGSFELKWFNPRTGKYANTETVNSGVLDLDAPFSGDAVALIMKGGLVIPPVVVPPAVPPVVSPPVVIPPVIEEPTEVVEIPTNSFISQFYDDENLGNLVLTSNDPEINFEWGSGSPDPSVPNDGFSARWQGNFDFESGIYEFTAVTDDGIRVWLNGLLAIDKWFDQRLNTYVRNASIPAGQHNIKVEYYEATGLATAKLSWKKIAEYGNTEIFLDMDEDGVSDLNDKCPGSVGPVNSYGCESLIFTKFSTELTTDLSDKDLTNVDLNIGVVGRGKIDFSESINLLDSNSRPVVLDNLIEFFPGRVVVHSDLHSGLNKPATITLNNITNITNPVILRDGSVCEDCKIISFTDGTLVFEVPHFTEYSVGEGFCGDNFCGLNEECNSCQTDCVCEQVSTGGGGGGGGIPLTCIPDWKCSDWTECLLGETVRICQDKSECNIMEGRPEVERDCGCLEEWECSAWTECKNDIETRNCIDTEACGTEEYKPKTFRECVYATEKLSNLAGAAREAPSIDTSKIKEIEKKRDLNLITLFLVLLVFGLAAYEVYHRFSMH